MSKIIYKKQFYVIINNKTGVVNSDIDGPVLGTNKRQWFLSNRNERIAKVELTLREVKE